ncbi:hypothetical protein ASC82_07160 [Streptomyces sp. Root431]|uniref:hypothetical protein n=1 Tax=Streptomyces sp. Root431 TaxID=1736535 RepID=UPI0006F54703|nr:hypothetical protein [Streptomyces sp. Root431]KQX13712.1 hypothetical protein ASC82_07160 [Streptomyces sp. Root431]
MNVLYARRGLASLAAAAVALLVAGCGAEEKPKADKPAATTTAAQTTQAEQGKPSAEVPTETLAVLKGQKGLELSINSAQRDAGGFLTIKGQLKNTSDSAVALPSQMRGDENEVVKHGNSLGGATLIDSAGKKRYYVLRDTDGRPLTTTALDIFSAGETAEVFMQFPAPPASTPEVSFQLPTFEPATLKLS